MPQVWASACASNDRDIPGFSHGYTPAAPDDHVVQKPDVHEGQSGMEPVGNQPVGTAGLRAA